MTNKTPAVGLVILQNLHKCFNFNQNVKSSLIDAYIRLGFHDSAIELINRFSVNKQDIQSLKFQAWLAHKQGDIKRERTIWNTILEKSYLPQVHNPISTLLLRGKHTLSLKQSDIPLISVVRNEMIRLPFFLEYYRKLGVTQFIFVDNNSGDGSFEFLIEQPDCHVFWTNDSFSEAGHGVTWLNYLINIDSILHKNQWYIIADADEFLVYPYSEKIKLSSFISYLNSENAESVSSFMLDMYPSSIEYSQDKSNFLKNHIYFYNNYHTFYQIESPYINISGGIRSKLFTEHNGYNVKTALLKQSQNKTVLLSSTHKTTPTIVSKITTTFLHYKFSGDLKSLSYNEIQRKQHSGGASRYRQYYNQLSYGLIYEDLSNFDNSVSYENSQQLIRLGLLNTTEEWNNYVSK